MRHLSLSICVRIFGIIFLLWTLVAALWYLDPGCAWTQRSELVLSRAKENSGKAWRYVPTAAQQADSRRWLAAVILENGKPLTHRRLSRETTTQCENGFWISSRNLWFSTSDGSDPHLNGRKYEIALPIMLPENWRKAAQRTWAWFGILLAGVALCRPIAEGAKVVRHSRFWQLVILIAVIRLVLVSYDEIIVSAEDAAEYTGLADAWYYNATPLKYYRLPVYPLFLALGSTTGIPLRLTIECVQLASYALLVAAMRRWGISQWAAAISFAWMTLSPQTAQWNNYVITDTLYPCFLFACIAFGLLWIDTRKWPYALTAGVLLGLAMNLREERIIPLGIAALLLTIAFVKVVWERFSAPTLHRSFWPTLRPLGAFVALFLGVGGALDFSFQAMFHARTGVWAHCLLSTPGLNHLMGSLYRIPPQGPLQRYFLVNQQMRDVASTLSPTFRDRQHRYEDEQVGWKKGALGEHGVTDFDTSGLVWCTLVEEVFTDGREGDCPYREQMMMRAANEIRQGLVGRPQQHVYLEGTFPINDAALTLWWQNLRPLLQECLWDYTFSEPAVGNFGREQVTPASIALFDRVANRRPSLAAVCDTTGDPRPGWIKQAWSGLYKLEIPLLYLAFAAAVLAFLAAAYRAFRRGLRREWIPWSPLAIFLLLAFLAATRLGFGTLVLVYYGMHVRYMICLALVSLPLLLILIDLLASFIHRTRSPQLPPER